MVTILYFYITIFTIYYIILALTSLKKPRRVRDKYTSKDANMCIIVYATGEVPMLENLIKQLKSQSYPKERYSIYVILDKCINPPEFIFQTDLDINLININNMEPIGKSQAYSIIAEKLSEVPYLDAYVFMDAKNFVDSDFLENVNFYLTKYNVFMPMIEYIGEYKNMKFLDCIKAVYSKYMYKFIYTSRSRLNLANLINTDNFIIKRDLLNHIGCFDFRDKISEAKFTLKTTAEGSAPICIEAIKIYKDIVDFDSRIPSLSRRLNIFWNEILSCKNFKSFEYLTSFLQPNLIFCLIIYFFLLWHTYRFPFFVSYSIILITFIILALAFCASLFNTKIYAKEFLYLFSYPLYSLAHITKNFPPIRFIINLVTGKNKKHTVEKMMVDIIVNDGKRDCPCKLELISDNGLSKIKFINKKKTYITKNNHLRMVDALKELSQKMSDYGLTLKVCYTCKYFQPMVDGSTNMIKGCCHCQFEGRVAGDIIPTLVWNTCPKFEKQNIVNLF